MLRIRLARFGTKKKPTYRVVVIDRRKGRDSKCLEVVGHYNPVAAEKVIHIDHDRVEHWKSVGAQPSETVRRLLARQPKPAEQEAEQPA
jgi:small subunit ribosomal protein S16